jgi:anti-sigma factor RsiW
MKITRDVVTDLWPLYCSGAASADTRAIVEEFLEQDSELARMLRSDDETRWLEPETLALEPDHELRALSSTRRALLTKNWPLSLALIFSCLAFGRIVADTSWDEGVSPWGFVVTASIAIAFWVTFLIQLVRTLKRLTPRA